MTKSGWFETFWIIVFHLACIFLFASLLSPAYSQTPNPVTPGYQVCSTASGSTKCGWVAVDASNPLPVTTGPAPSPTSPLPTASNPYPAGATPITASATGTTAAVVATLSGAASRTTYICGMAITSTATAAVAGNATVTGPVSGTLNFVQGVGLSPAVATLSQVFIPCVPSSAANTAIVVNSAAAGAGGVTAVSAWGYRQ